MSDAINQSMLDLFFNELILWTDLFRKAVSELKLGKKNKECLDELTKNIHAIKSAAKIMQFNSIASLAKALEIFFADVQKSGQKLSEEVLSLLTKIAAEFEAFTKIDKDTLKIKINQPVAIFEKLLEELTHLPSMALHVSEIPSVKIEAPISQQEEIEFVHDPTMMELFRAELDTQTKILNEGILALGQADKERMDFGELMRAAHSIKGAARVVGLDLVIKLAHSLEDYFVEAQKGGLKIKDVDIDVLLKAVDILVQISHISHIAAQVWVEQEKNRIIALTNAVETIISGKEASLVDELKNESPEEFSHSRKSHDRVLRVTAFSLNRLMGLAGESLVETRWLQPFADLLFKQKKLLDEMLHQIDLLRESLADKNLNEVEKHYLAYLQQKGNESRQNLNDRLAELELFISRHSSLSDRLYREVIDSRMRPFADCVEAFPRMVRDVARQLHKKVRLEITGKSTPVDRDILEKLESPLGHLLRNSVDHGIETPEQRLALGKPPEGVIRLDAQHRGGMLAITVSDDGRGVDIGLIRQKIIEKNLVKPEIAAKLTEHELLDFLFLPGFSTAIKLTDISGRGIGLNVVQTMIQEVSGSIKTTFETGKGMVFSLLLPLTLSVIRSLIVEISGEPYAFPLSRIERAILLKPEDIKLIENRQYFKFEENNIGLIQAWQVLDLDPPKYSSQVLSVVVLNERTSSYGIVVDHFLGEKELVVQEIDSRFGKIPDISSGAFMEDGAPILIIDVEDMIRSIDNILHGGRLQKLTYGEKKATSSTKKRILVVDDSITVREVECRLLRNHGYEVETAVNGMDGWNAIRLGHYDLIVTDVDMPRMNGIELVRTIRADPRLKNLPVMIVSYKERDEDRLQGLEAGANYYLTKSSFHDQTLLNGVVDLIGES